MAARDYQYYISQLRRIEAHREQQAEKEIRKLYRKILKETRQFIAEEYYQLAEDGKLTFEILRSKSMDARFLQEVEERLGDLSIDVSGEIKRTVEEMYQLSYDGLRNAVEKGKDSKELQAFFQGVDTATAQTAWASVDNTIMDVALEKNHKNIIWDIKREVATALTVGDRFDTMADRIAGKLNGNYKKAILIARTEVGRVREAGHLASAKNLNYALENGSSGMRMVKKWMTMRDGSVRDTHSRMNGVIVEMDDPFTLPSGVKTMAPKQSGVASEDCNCRCYVSYQLMDDEEFFKATGKHFSDGSSQMSRPHTYTGSTWPKDGTKISAESLKELTSFAKDYGISLQSFENFDGDVSAVKEIIQGISEVKKNFSLGDKKRIILHNSFGLSDDDFAETIGHNVYINNFAFRDKDVLANEYAKKAAEGWFVRGTDYRSIAYHEMGHVLTNFGKARTSNVVRNVFPRMSPSEIDEALKNGLSEYATVNVKEAIAEAVSAYYSLANPPGLALTILRACGIL